MSDVQTQERDVREALGALCWQGVVDRDRDLSGKVLDFFRSLPVEQRMEVMGMEEVGEYDENGVWRSFGYWEEADAPGRR